VCKGGGQAYSRYFEARALRVIEGNYAPTFTVDLMHKDLTLAARMAGPGLEHMPILREALAAYGEARASGWGAEDFSGVTHVVDRRFGGPLALQHPA
jgi:3-hydroxyisobutyrate dehydrogenase-like beta-hydroxyacid dehydrogenase